MIEEKERNVIKDVTPAAHPPQQMRDKITVKIINYQIRKLAEIDRHEEFVAADFYM